MARYRKKPVEIEAHRWFRNGDHPQDGPAEREGKVVRYFRHPQYEGQAVHAACGQIWHEHGWIDSLEYGYSVCPGDWVITGVQGEFYPCVNELFDATYEAVDG